MLDVAAPFFVWSRTGRDSKTITSLARQNSHTRTGAGNVNYPCYAGHMQTWQPYMFCAQPARGDDGQSNTVNREKDLTETRVSKEGAKIGTNTALALLLFSFTRGVGERKESLVTTLSCFYFGNVVTSMHSDHALSNHSTNPHNFSAAAGGNNTRFSTST